MPKGPIDETKLRTGEEGPGALSTGTLSAPSDGARPTFDGPAQARAPMAPVPMRARKSPVGGILVIVLLAAAVGGALYYFLR